MNPRLLIATTVVVLTASLVYWSWGSSPPPALAAPAPAADESVVPVSAPVEREAVQPEPVVTPPATEPKAAEPFDTAAAHVDAWLAQFVVVDEDEQPVGDAVITLWAGKRSQMDPRMAAQLGLKGNSYSGHESQALLELHTDASGHVQARLELECLYAQASKPGLGNTGEQMLWHQRSAATPTEFVIETPIVQRGNVLRTDGSPAPGAKVIATVNGMSSLQRGNAPAPEPVVTGSDGRFELPVRLHSGYNVYAEIDGVRTFADHFWIRSREPDDITLTFPGAITLAGEVVDQGGMPAAGAEVSAWREFHIDDPKQDPDADERVNGKADEHGRFSLAVRKHARYQLIASADGQANSMLMWAETTAVRPHAEVRLELLAFAPITGRVLHEDGSPFAGVKVGARPETGESHSYSAVPNQGDQFPRVTVATTGDDGSFALKVHPATTWTVFAMPDASNHRLRLQLSGVAPGRKGVELRVTAADLAGCVVHGKVLRADGQPVGFYGVDIVNYEDGAPRSSSDGNARIDGESFTLPRLPLGNQYGLRVSPKDSAEGRTRGTGPLAPVVIGPFVTDQPDLSFEFRFEAWGEVPVRVLAADGSPAHKVRVGAFPDVDTGFYPSAMPVDADGKIQLQRCVPGAHHLRVFDETRMLHEQELLVTPGPNPEVVARLPADQAGKKD